MLIIKFIKILFFFIFFNYYSYSKADIKTNIIENINNSDSIKFDFVQITDSHEEKGICYLRRPYYLKCEYNDKNQKELIVNRNQLIIYHKRYEKIYKYPLSKSFFKEILDKQEFSEIVSDGIIKKENEIILINRFLNDKGQIIFYFNSNNFNLEGWDLISLNDNKIQFKIYNIVKNFEIEKRFFDIPKTD